MTPVIGYLVVHEQFTVAFGLFVAAGLTDMVSMKSICRSLICSA